MFGDLEKVGWVVVHRLGRSEILMIYGYFGCSKAKKDRLGAPFLTCVYI